jgi:uncharacterized protein YcnI
MSIALLSLRLVPRAGLLRRSAVVGVSAAAALVLLAAPALAHITVTPDAVPAGSTVVLTFHVPDEQAHADTVKVDVQIPVSHPIAQLLVQPVPGWTFTVKTVTLAKPIVTDDGSFSQAVSEVIWSGGRIRPGQFQSFTISADPMPTGEGQVAFKAIQTYSNGDIVRWIDLPQPGQPAPEHPAPVVRLTTTTAPASAAHRSAAPAATAPGTDGLSRALGVAGLAAGLLAGLLALMVARRSRRLAAVDGRSGGAPVPAGTGGQFSDNGRADGNAAARREQPAAASKTPARRPVPPNAKTSSRPSQRRRRG